MRSTLPKLFHCFDGYSMSTQRIQASDVSAKEIDGIRESLPGKTGEADLCLSAHSCA